MTYMFEVFYHCPVDPKREAALTACIGRLGGRLDYREETNESNGSVCLTFEFDRPDNAESAAQILRERGEYVEGPQEYGREMTSI